MRGRGTGPGSGEIREGLGTHGTATHWQLSPNPSDAWALCGGATAAVAGKKAEMLAIENVISANRKFGI